MPHVHSLPTGWGMDVGGITGEEDAAHPVALSLSRRVVEMGKPTGAVHSEVGACSCCLAVVRV
jgi:hypothetical protein